MIALTITSGWYSAPAQAQIDPSAGLPASPYVYVGADNAETRIRFRSRVELPSDSRPTGAQVSAAIEAQIHLLAGPMEFQTPRQFSPRRTHSISGIHVAPAAGKPGIYSVEYDYDGTVLAQFRIPLKTLLIVALRPERLWQSATAGLAHDALNPCTNPDYPSRNDFWHFWSPNWPGCRLALNQDYLEIPATLSELPNTRQTLPEYSRLVNEQGEINMTFFFGLEHFSADNNPYVSEDVNAPNYLATVNELLARGFVRSTPVIPETAHPMYVVEDFVKQVPPKQGFEGQPSTLRARLFFGNTKYQNDESKIFHRLLKPALESDALVAYLGHSGLGKNMNLDYIAKNSGVRIRLNPSIYQIFFMSSCSSYEYYNEPYFAQKITPDDPRGTHNLDLITNGLESLFRDNAGRVQALIAAIDRWASFGQLTPYPTLLAKFPGAALTGVVGDEDNPTLQPVDTDEKIMTPSTDVISAPAAPDALPKDDRDSFFGPEMPPDA